MGWKFSWCKTPWKWFNGQILAIIYGANWIVKTTRGVYLTNGFTVKSSLESSTIP